MKRTKRYLRILALLVLCFTLSACGFVDYILYDDAEAIAEFSEAMDEYLEKIRNISSSDLYLEEDRRQYELALIDAENELRECTTIEELETVYQKHYEIITAIPTELSYLIENMLQELRDYVSLSDYRAAEQKLINELISKYEKELRAAVYVSDADKLFRDFEAEIFEIKTDAVYLAEELVVMKNGYLNYYGENINYATYRQEQRELIEELTATFKTELDTADTAQEATNVFNAYLDALAALPTEKILFSAEKTKLISDWTNKLNSFNTRYSLSYNTYINSVIEQMSGLSQLEEINRLGASLIISMCGELGEDCIEDLRDAAIIYAENAVNLSEYRAADHASITASSNTLKAELRSASATATIYDIVKRTDPAFAHILTNAEQTQSETALFLQKLNELYGNDVLELPESLTTASSYEELASIIDYYAFYQISGTEFLCDTFRVDLNFPFKAAQWEINEVYWYCELIRSGAGITGEYEKGSNCLVFTLIPYNIASVSNATSPAVVERYDSLVKYSGNTTALRAREKNFSAFPYLSEYTRYVSGVWNTQQLWYSLEHEYIPLTVAGSAAEAALKRSEDILREAILEGMSEEEKIFAIFSWFGQNMTYDHQYNNYLLPLDREHFPDELAATLNSFHAEGALFDNLSVCCAFAKAYLILLRMEGIEAYRVFMHSYTENAINNLDREGYGSHALVAIRMSDGKFYYSDTEQSYLHTDERFVKYHQLAVSPDLHWPYNDGMTNMYDDFEFGASVHTIMSQNLTYNGRSIFVKNDAELKAILDDFAAESRTGIQVSIFCYKNDSFSPIGTISNDGRFDYTTFSFGGLTEYIIFK